MIDFTSVSFLKLKKIEKTPETVLPLILDTEEIVGNYKGIRDYVVFTDKRIITLNTHGVAGSKKDFTSLPYSKIQLFSIENDSNVEDDCSLELYVTSIGKVKFDFSGPNDIVIIGKMIAEHTL